MLHLDETITNGNHLFDGCANLLEIKPLTNTFNTVDYMFNNCSNLLDVDMSNVNFGNYTSATYMCNGCSKFTKTPIFVISDTCTNISYLFANSGITDISGMTFGSGIKTTASWIPPNLTTANNVIIKNNYINFYSCGTVKTINNLLITKEVTTLESFLASAINLESFTFNKNSDLSNVTSLRRFLINNAKISRLDFSGFKLTSVSVMSAVGENQGFIANTNVGYADFSNCVFGNKKISWTWLTNNCTTQESITFDFTNAIMPVINFNRFGWNSGDTKHYFKFNGADFKYWTTFARMFATDATHINGVDFTDAKFSHITDFSDMFNATNEPQYNGIHITEDIVFPASATNVARAFKGCASLTHVHSNWNNTYTNGITSTDCYAGCNGITHIDDENVIAYEGDLGTDYIPLDWGGNGFATDCTMIYELDITEQLLNTPLKPIGIPSLLALDASVAKVNWGDGSPAELLCVNNKITEHTYTTTGTYFVKAHASMGHGYGQGFAGAISKILQVPKYERGRINNLLQYACSGASNMTYVDFSNLVYEKGVTKFKLGFMFNNCNKLKTVIIPSDWIIEECDSMFDGCSSLESVDFLKSWDTSNCTSVKGTFSNCSSLTSLDLSKWNAFNVTIMSSMFNGCTSLKTLTLGSWNTSKVTDMSSMFKGCILSENDFKNIGVLDWDVSKCVYFSEMFSGCQNLKTLDLSNWTIKSGTHTFNSGGVNFNYFVRSCLNLESIKFKSDIPQVRSVMGMFLETSKLKTIENCPIHGYDNGDMGTMYWAYGNNNQIYNGLNMSFSSVGGFKAWTTKPYINFFDKISLETMTNLGNAMYDYASEGISETLSTNGYLARFSEEQIAIFTNKGWTLT